MKDIKILPLISIKCINTNLRSKNKENVIKELVDLLDADNVLTDKNRFTNSLIEREKLCSTGLEDGVAFLHPRYDVEEIVNKPAIGIGISKDGIDFDSIDEDPTFVFFILCFKKLESHLQYLTYLNRLCTDTEFLNDLLESKNAEDIIKSIDKKEKTGSLAGSFLGALYPKSIIDIFKK
ncbi:MAG: PTS sugar transporter subunit IIA [bacterium]|nr:PTS sugar transporter subunit IIA [bacterium]